MAQCKMSCFVKGMNTFLSGKMYVTKPRIEEDDSWQRKATMRGYNFVHDLFLSDNISDKFDLFNLFLKEAMDKTIQKTWLKWEVELSSNGKSCTVLIPFKSHKDLFHSTLNKTLEESTAFKEKVLKGLADANIEVLNINLINPVNTK